MTFRRPTSVLRVCAIVGVGLIAISMTMANFRWFEHGDMRIFQWAAAVAIILVVGGIPLLVAIIGGAVVAIRRMSARKSSSPSS